VSIDELLEQRWRQRRPAREAEPREIGMRSILDAAYARREDAAGQHEERVKADAARLEQLRQLRREAAEKRRGQA
jgi:hypothetical protein